MTSELEAVFRQLLRSVVQEVAEEVRRERQSRDLLGQPNQSVGTDRLLLRASEAAELLAISPTLLHRLTAAGTLPCVRVGRLVRYSVRSLEEWIADGEASAAPKVKDFVQPRPRASQAGKPTGRPVTKRARSAASEGKRVPKPNKARSKVRHQARLEGDDIERMNPFRLLLKGIGIDRNQLGPLTNGELMRIAGVDVPTFHGWMYLGRQMPEEALEKLRNHFRQCSLPPD